MTQSIIQVDAFTNARFKGNPAAVCVMPAEADATWMQQIAAEMNLSETAFLVEQPTSDSNRKQDYAVYSLRWFTPTVEVNLCGHATLASAHVLWTEGLVPSDRGIYFQTQSGLLTATVNKQSDGNWITMDFPSQPVQPIDPPPELIEALEINVLGVYASQANYLIELANQTQLETLEPDLSKLAKLPLEGAIVTAGCAKPYDFCSRYFAPQAGINEDPVTGSAHCSLAPFWKSRLNQSDFLAYQASDRGGVLKVSDRGDHVSISGQAITVMKGQLV